MSVSLLLKPSSSLTSTSPAQRTQNTAPIIEHQCLYTHDLRRKAKRWQDGFLRYHTFNKRVMVYDIPRNYIGDSHWREDYPLQDGDELELDRPVLVQVGEQVGMTEQDLTGLLEKRQKKAPVNIGQIEDHRSSPSAVGAPQTLHTVAAAPYHLQPKSLNALLGTPNGKVGKARLPVKSPYELRNDNEQGEVTAERPIKRRCFEPASGQGIEGIVRAPTEVDLPQTHVTAAPVQVIHRRPRASRTLHTGKRPEGQSTVASPTPLENATGAPKTGVQEDAMSSFTSSSRHTHATEFGIHQETVAQTRISCTKDRPIILNSGQPSETSVKISQRARPKQVQRPSGSPPHGLSIDSSTTKVLSRENEAVDEAQPKMKAKLQIAARKPRRKLMYNDVVDQDVSAGPKSRRGRGNQPEKEAGSIPPSLQTKEGRFHDQDAERQISAELIAVTDEPYSRPKERKSAQARSHDALNRQQIGASKKLICSDHDGSSITATRRVPHDTSLALAKMDEILDSRSQSFRQKEIPTPIHDVLSSPPEHYSPPSKPGTPPDLDSKSVIVPSRFALPVTQVPSSPLALPPAESQEDEHALFGAPDHHDTVTAAAMSLEAEGPLPGDSAVASPSQLARERSPTEFSDFVLTEDSPRSRKSSRASPILDTANAPSSLEHIPVADQSNTTCLPTFRPPQPISKPRSYLRKSFSDTSAATESYKDLGKSQAGMSVSLKASAGGQGIYPWSKEAWDLFGCGQDGAAVGFKEFCQRIGA